MRILIRQEAYYLVISIGIGSAVALNSGYMIGAKVALACFFVLQPIIIYANWPLIRAIVKGE